MNKTCIALLALIVLAAMPARAQLTSTITTTLHDSTFSLGRDFWFAEQSNQWGVDLGGKYMRIYITSPENATAFVSSNGQTTPIPITANEISSFKVPLSWEMESSGIVENQAIHVYSNTADLAVYNISHQPYSSDGEYVIPTIGWGTDYVVAAYGSIDDQQGSFGTDAPSTMVIVANEDSTLVEITPSVNCRKDSSGNQNGGVNAMTAAFPADSTFTIQLNRGQCMQLMPVFLEGPPFLDLTGTIVHSNKPVGVFGGSQITNIPSTFPYANHVEDMMPPVRTWGETYYANNTVQEDTMPSHDVAQYLFISSVPNQTIFRHSCDSSDDTECVIAKQYGIFWDEIKGPRKFFSAQPFLAVQYVNSSSYPDGVTGQGDPAEAMLTPREQYTKTVTFETPLSVGNIVPFTNYANVTVNVKDEKKTLFDGKTIDSFPKYCIDSNWEMFLIPYIAPSVDSITGDDSGVGVWIYGYGYDETYAWSAPSQCKTFQSPDSVPPVASVTESCMSGHVYVQDTGALASKLDMIRLDTLYNIDYSLDTSWIEGTMRDSTFYNFEVADPTQPAYLQVSAFDYAGNHTAITSIYRTNYDSIFPFDQSLGVWVDTPGSKPNIAYDTIYTLGQDTFYFNEFHLTNDSAGFSLHDSIGGPLDLSPLAPKHRRRIQIQFEPIKTTPQIDSIVFGDVCDSSYALVIGAEEFPNFLVTSQIWPNAPLTDPATCYLETVTIENLSSIPIMIDSFWWADTVHFKALSTIPVTLPPYGSVPFSIDYCPDSGSLTAVNRTQGIWFSSLVLESGIVSPRFDSLIGWALGPLGVSNENSPSLEATIFPINDGRSLQIILPSSVAAPVNFQLVNVLGESVLRETFSAGTQMVDASALPRGVYFYRFTSGQISQSGKVILGQ